MNGEVNIEVATEVPVVDGTVEGLDLNAEIVQKLTKQSGKILSWRKTTQKKFKATSEDDTEVRTVLSVTLDDNGAIMDYYPNKTSIRRLVNQYGVLMPIWVGQPIKWVVKEAISSDGEDQLQLYVAKES